MKKNEKIIIVDYDMGNLGSIVNMIKKVGGRSEISKNIKTISLADKIILPGDGAFDAGMVNLKKFKLLEILKKKSLREKIPVLGICLGMQLLSYKSEEGFESGLCWIKAKTVRFKFKKNDRNLRIPHMGWNTIEPKKKSALLKNMPAKSRFYFVHSYHLECENSNDIVALSEHGYEFPSIIEHENIYATQFHPEKSHKYGMIIYENFLKIPC